jgi:hypothetical protein
MEGNADVVVGILDFLCKTYGPWTVLGVAAGAYLFFLAYRIYQTRSNNAVVTRAMDEMEKAVQRSAAEAREYRIAVFKEKFGWTQEELDAYIIRNVPLNGPEARKALEPERGSK